MTQGQKLDRLTLQCEVLASSNELKDINIGHLREKVARLEKEVETRKTRNLKDADEIIQLNDTISGLEEVNYNEVNGIYDDD